MRGSGLISAGVCSDQNPWEEQGQEVLALFQVSGVLSARIED